MNTNNDDRELRQLFQELRECDRRNTPAFRDVRSAAGQRRMPPRALVWMRVAAAASLLATAVSVGVFRARMTGPSETDISRWSAFSDWEASTDGLLSMSSVNWNGSPDRPSDSFSWTGIEEATSETTKSNGKETL